MFEIRRPPDDPAERSWAQGLNAGQLAAVTTDSRPTLVVAGAGTGKTLTLACRVAYLIERGVPPARLLLLTFTRRAAREMLERARRMTGEVSTSKVWGGTFHAMANRLLRMHGRSIGVRPDFTVMDQADAADVMNLIRDDLGLAKRERRFPRKDTLAAIYSRTVNTGVRLPEAVDSWFPWCRDDVGEIRSIFRSYVVRKREQNVLDYDDLLLHWAALARSQKPAGGAAGLFDHILVDEYQDTNAIQAEILRHIGRGVGLMVVGDDAQSIYSFRAATVRNILQFPNDFPGARVLRLEQNYRSTPPLLAVSNAVIALSPERHEKTLWSERPARRRPELVTCLDEAEQSDAVCRRILEHREAGVLLKRQAVLFRAAHHSDFLEVELARRNIPFVKYGGLKFLEAAHVKDVLAVLRILENPHDEVSWFRVLQLLEGMGPSSARSFMERLGVRRGPGSEPSPLRRLLDDAPDVTPAAFDGVTALRTALHDCLESGSGPSGDVERITLFLEPLLLRHYRNPRERMRDLEQLALLASGYPNRARFITELTLDPPSSTGDLAGPPLLDEDYLVLSTIHSAKGLEWQVIHVIHAADGMIPSDMATGSPEEIEEERRLLYVAMTRARDVLHVYFPLRYYHRPRGLEDGHNYAQLTRFLPRSIQDLFDRRTEYLAAEADADPSPTAAVGSAAAVDEFLSALWKE
ncbi:MAG TPA: ATP-dependent helicase [Actinomycetota bacterium]|nr:ATP-dependent helicase [Actinomycetota bacterium]